MSRVRFRAGDIELELTGSEPFMLRQLKLLSAYLDRVDNDALDEPREVAEAPPQVAEPELAAAATEPAALPREEAAETAPAAPAAAAAAAPPTNGGHATTPGRPTNGGAETPDDLIRFYGRFQPQGLDRQSDAALLFAYYLQQREGLPSLQLGDLIRCCIRAGVDTRNFNRTLGILTRRGYLETVRHGHAYRLSEHGVAAVESRM